MAFGEYVRADAARWADAYGRVPWVRLVVFEPGFQAVLWLRLREVAQAYGWPGKLLRRWVRWWLAVAYGCHVSTIGRLGKGLHLPHPVGIVLGEGCVVEDHVTLYQNVTLGQNGRPGETAFYPTIGTGAILYAGAVVVGGVRVGGRAVVGANSVVLHDVPDGGVAVGVPARVLPREGKAD